MKREKLKSCASVYAVEKYTRSFSGPAGISVIFPLLALIAIAIKVDSPGSSIFRQERVGKDGRRFTIYKFRSVYENHNDSEYKRFLQKYMQEGLVCEPDYNGPALMI
ncbi:MAG: hypothetical protein AMJ43_07330 [Coxiella sp. DG_40]|nr:MAG: hypothetical protein AMJ43_07330 [Coxiella sp. DG_40]